MNWMKWIEWIERGVENSCFWIEPCWKVSWWEGGGKPRFFNRILSLQCETGKICPLLFSKACGCANVILFFLLLDSSFPGCAEMKSEKTSVFFSRWKVCGLNLLKFRGREPKNSLLVRYFCIPQTITNQSTDNKKPVCSGTSNCHWAEVGPKWWILSSFQVFCDNGPGGRGFS